MVEIHNILDVENYVEDVDAVVFDLDDTLYSEKEYVRSGFKAVARLFPEIENMGSLLWQSFENGGKAIDEVLLKYGKLAYKETALHTYRYHTPEIHLYPGVDDMLKRLKSAGKKIGIITDGRTEGQHAKIEALGLKVDEIIITDELGGIEYRKPNATAFIEMQKKFDVPFERMVYVGDNIRKDFVAPKHLSMQCILFKNNDGLYK